MSTPDRNPDAQNGPIFMDLADVSDFAGENQRPKRVLFLADNRHAAKVVIDHISAFANHSVHEIVIKNPIHDRVPISHWFSQFDAILIHYSIYILSDYFLPDKWVRAIADFEGFKAQIIQDEHRQVNAMMARIANIGISAVFSSLESKTALRVYRGELLRNVHIFSCLPGYVAENFYDFSPPKIADRPLDIVYRGRTLPPFLGRHAQEKRQIGEQVQAAALQHGLSVDISSDEDRRIYGSAWPKFLMSGRATLGVEGGASIFDFDGRITDAVIQYQKEYPGAGFETIWERVLKSSEGNVVHKTITPKILEAIATKTALILYPGKYRGILEPGRHYIELARDSSNLDEVMLQVKDVELLQNMVDRTYEEVVFRDELSMRFYVRKIDAVIFSKSFYRSNYDNIYARIIAKSKKWLLRITKNNQANVD